MDKIKKVSDMLRITKPKEPVKVTITGAAGNIGYALCFMVAQGYMLGDDQPIILCLSEIPPMADVLKGVAMELQDSSFPLVEKIVVTTDDKIAFEGCDIALLVGAKPRTKGMDRADLLQANAKIFQNQAKFLDDYANPDCKICVVGNPANTNARILAEYTQKIKKENITCLTRLDQNRAMGQISEKLQVPVKNIRNAVIWGNHSKTQFPDLQICEALKDGQTLKVPEQVTDSWTEDFIKRVQDRGAEIISVRQKSSAASAASAICDHMRSWILGTQQGEVVSMGVWSNNNPYNIKNELIFSFPVTCSNGEWKFYEGLDLSQQNPRSKILQTENELVAEMKTALAFLKNNQIKQFQVIYVEPFFNLNFQIYQYIQSMGNNNQVLKEINKSNVKRENLQSVSKLKSSFKGAIVLKDPQGKQYLEKQYLYDNNDQLIFYKNAVKLIQDAPKGYYLQVVLAELTKQQIFCSANSLKLIFEYFDKTLQDILFSNNKQDFFQENIIWKMIIDCSEILAWEDQHKVQNDFVHPQSIYFDSAENKFKFIFHQFFQENNFSLAVANQKHYCSPELFCQMLSKNKDYFLQQRDVSNIFSLGVIILRCIFQQEFSHQKVYKNDLLQTDIQYLYYLTEQLKLRGYSEFLVRVINDMLQELEHLRISPSKLIKLLIPYKMDLTNPNFQNHMQIYDQYITQKAHHDDLSMHNKMEEIFRGHEYDDQENPEITLKNLRNQTVPFNNNFMQ